MKTCFTRLLLCLLGSTLPALGQIDLSFVTNNGAITITGYGRMYSPVVTLPAGTNGYPVTSIADNAFYQCTLSSITLPDSITNIGNSAFASSGSLRSVTFGVNVASIGHKAFYNCFPLMGITIPNSVTSLGTNVFYNCQSLTNVTIGTNVTNLGAEMFVNCVNLHSIVIPDSVTNLADRAFDQCTALATITLGNGLTSLGQAFTPCTSIKSLILGTNLSSIEDRAFSGSGLTNLSLPDSMAWVGSNAFSSSYGLRNLTMGTGALALGPGAFGACSGLTNVSFGTGVLSLGTNAFAGCGFTQLTIPGCITNIADYAFSGCLGLVTLSIGPDATSGSATRIGNAAFKGDSHLANVIIGSNVTSIGAQAFSGCNALTNATLAGSVTNLGSFAFYNDSLSSVYFQGNPPSYDGTVFVTNFLTCIYYWPGASGWGPTYDGVPAYLQSPPFLCQQTNGTLSITRYTGPPGAVTFPSMIAGMPVTSVGPIINLGITSVIIPSSVTNLGSFYSPQMKAIYFEGDAPTPVSSPLIVHGVLYYLPGATGWSSTFYGHSTAVWAPQIQTADGSFGLRTNQFGFNIFWADDQVVVVEASTDLANRTWTPLSTNHLTGGTAYFSDSEWAHFPTRFYRLRSP